ncbi:MAG: peptidoglycan DD-metalloendopeptidase family protein, partial [Motiliproteus sp.]|nr:peptidoglycan DD-metalloendopeptidase family protein [Motiliproteus sp.]
MKNRLVLTLTTTRGSRQYSLSKLAKYLVLAGIALIFVGFILGNYLLVKTTDQLTLLEIDHRSLEGMYEDALDSRELYKTSLDELSDTLDLVQSERDRFEQKSAVALTERDKWAETLFQLEQKMGLLQSEMMTLERSKELQQIANERLFMLRGIPNGRPLKKGRRTDGFGMRKHPVTKKKKSHNGVDWSTHIGTPIFATADGAVEYSGYHKKSGYGKLLIISHNFGFKTYYGHMDKLLVKNGSVIRKGQLVGYSGNTGISTGPHLHYEVRYLFKPLNPDPFLKWDMDNYNNIFTQVKGIAWESLR